MSSYSEIISLETVHSNHWINITGQVNQIVRSSGITEGVVHVSSAHTTAGVTVNESADPDVEYDFFEKLARLFPRQEDFYRHGEGNSDSHLKTSVIGITATIPLRSGRLDLGTWQAVYFCEFDGPRSGRRCRVTVTG
ncbi:MAG: secondary thiamine-phosphate synthase enzyme YjbQ [Fibrobacterota bacterium]